MRIVEQGFICNDSQYYFLGIKPKDTLERIPIVAKKGHSPIYCAIVTVMDPTTKRFKYLKADNLPDEVIKFMSVNNYKVKNA